MLKSVWIRKELEIFRRCSYSAVKGATGEVDISRNLLGHWMPRIDFHPLFTFTISNVELSAKRR